MKEIKDVDTLSKEELIKALVYTNTALCDAREIINDINKYYDLLSADELKERIDSYLIAEDRAQKVSALEMRVRAIKIDKQKAVRTIEAVMSLPVVKPQLKTTKTEEMVAELFIRPYVKDVVEICDGVIGVKLRDPTMKYKVKIVAKKVGYTGEVIYNG
jgi:putative N-acetylmannosamine-6-phosphate epimerase